MGAENSEATRSGESTGFADFSANSFPWLAYGPDWGTDGFYGNAFTVPPYFLDSYKRGEVLPVYLDYHQLKIIRDRNRRLAAENEFAVAAIENRKAYIFGTGFKYRVLPVGEHVDPDVVKTAQRVLDVFCRVNRMSQIERELSHRCDRDGEAFIRSFPQKSGLLELRWIEPEHVRPPGGNSYEPQYSFGIETDPYDVMKVRGYWVVESPILQGLTPKFVKADLVNHIKRGTDSGAKRGLPLFYPVEANLRRAEELQAALTSTAKIRAKIAMIRKLPGSPRGAAQALKNEAESGQVIDPSTGMTTNVEQYKYGTILTTTGQMEYEFPKDGGVQGGVEILDMELRCIAAMLVLPESTLTANAGNAGGMAQLVAEAPATRNFECLQAFYRNELAENRDSLAWKQLRHAVACDLLDRDTESQINVVAHAPSIVARDPDKSSAAAKTYFDMGATSPQQICSDLGLNYEQITAERKEAGIPSPAELAAASAGMGGDVPGQGMNDVAAQAGNGDPNATGDEGPSEFEFDSSEFE